METIRAAQLRKLRACKEQVADFIELFGESEVPVTRANLLSAKSLDLRWAVENLWPDLRDEYERQVAPLRDEYERQRAPLWAEYQRQSAPLWDEYVYRRDLLWHEYDRQCAKLIADLLQLPQEGC